MKRITRYAPIFFIILLAVIIRLLYASYNPEIRLRPDTFGYYDLGKQILSDHSFVNIFNERRGTVYPIFIGFILSFTNTLNSPLLSPDFYTGIGYIVTMQMIVGLLSLFVLYKILQLLKIKVLYAYLFSVLMALNPSLFLWDREIMTETLGIFLLLLTAYLFLKSLQKPSLRHFITLFIIATLSYLNRPIFIALPFILLIILFLYHKNKTTKFASLAFLVIHIGLILFIVRHNTIQFGYKGFTRQLDLALLGKILHYNLPVEQSQTSPYYRDNILSYRKINGDLNPFRFIEYYDYDIYSKNYRFNEMKVFTLEVISQNLPEFLYKSTLEVPQALLTTPDIKPFNPPKHDLLNGVFHSLYFLYHNLQYITLLIIPAIFISLYRCIHPSYPGLQPEGAAKRVRWVPACRQAGITETNRSFFSIKKRTWSNTVWLTIGLISLYQVVLSVYLDYEDFGRLISIASPFLYLFSFYWLKEIINKLNRHFYH